MAHSLSAKKRVRQTAKRNARNRFRKEQLKTVLKGFTAALTAGDTAAAGESLNKVVQRLDRNAAKGVIHKNAAARKRSRLTKRLNAQVANGGKPLTPVKPAKAKAAKTAKA